MKKSLQLLLTFIITFVFISHSQIVYAAKGFVVEQVESEKILISDGYSQYLIENDYDCYDSDFYEGQVIYIDTLYSPSYGDKIIISGYSKTVCEVTDSDSVNIKKYYVDEVFDSKDKIIVTDKNNDQFLVEYGIGCGLSMWRYEGKAIDIDIGGSYLDGIGDQIYLFDSGRDCRVWDVEDLGGSSSGSYSPGTPCPINSSNISGVCTCNTGYIVNDAKTACVVQVVKKYGIDKCFSLYGDQASYDLEKDECGCKPGNYLSGSKCISNVFYCQSLNGPNATYNFVAGVCACNADSALVNNQCVLNSLQATTVETSSPSSSKPTLLSSASTKFASSKSKINIRLSQSAKAKIIGVTKPNNKYEVFKDQNGWVQIKNDKGQLGWVMKKYMTVKNINK